MTRFLLSLDQAVDTVFQAVREGAPGETYVPIVASARVTDIARLLIGDRKIETRITGIRPGEKIHEILVSEEEALRTIRRGNYYAMQPMLPEIAAPLTGAVLQKEYSSATSLMAVEELAQTLRSRRLMLEDVGDRTVETLA
jgi:UDP-glucose 4-epimerase